MRRLLISMCLVGTLAVGIRLGLLGAQEPPPGLCESQIRDQYQALVTDQLLQPEPGALTWGQQLTALVKKVRLLNTQYALRRQQADSQAQQSELTLAQLVEQNRELQARLQQMLQTQAQSQVQSQGVQGQQKE